MKLLLECEVEIEAIGAAGAAVVTIVVEEVVEAEAEEEETVEKFEVDEVEDEAKGLRLRFFVNHPCHINKVPTNLTLLGLRIVQSLLLAPKS